MNYLSLFSGAGGFEWFAKLMGWRCVGYVEKDEFCKQVLRARIRDGIFDDAPIFSDVRTFDGRIYAGKVDLIIAGFPCSPYSSAARGRNTLREDVWNHVARVVYHSEPEEVFCENTSRRAIDQAAEDLEEMGYTVRCTELSAADLGADHVRLRFWLRAYTDSYGKHCGTFNAKMAKCSPVRQNLWDTYPDELRVADGMAHRSHRLRALGNGIVPAVAREAWMRLTA